MDSRNLTSAGLVTLLVGLATAIIASGRIPIWWAIVPIAAALAVLLAAIFNQWRRPLVSPGPSFYRAAGGSNRIAVKVVNAGRPGTFYARVVDVRLMHSKGWDITPDRGAPSPPWPIPWNPGTDWYSGPGPEDQKRALLRKQSDTLWIGWMEVRGDKPLTFSFYGVDHHQPYGIENGDLPGTGFTSVLITLRIWNEESGSSWASEVRIAFDRGSRDPHLPGQQVARSLSWQL